MKTLEKASSVAIKLNTTLPEPTKPGEKFFNNSVSGQCTDCMNFKTIMYAFASTDIKKRKPIWRTIECSDCFSAIR